MIAKIFAITESALVPGHSLTFRTYIVRISEEAGAGDDHRTNMIPTERQPVDLAEQQSAPFIRIEDVVIDIEDVSVARAARKTLERRHCRCRACQTGVSFPCLVDDDEHSHMGKMGKAGWTAV